MYSKAIKIENMALVRKCPKTFMIMTKANQAPVELSTAASALLERTRLFLELPGLSLQSPYSVWIEAYSASAQEQRLQIACHAIG